MNHLNENQDNAYLNCLKHTFLDNFMAPMSLFHGLTISLLSFLERNSSNAIILESLYSFDSL